MGDKCNCYRFSPRDSLSGAVAQIADYLSKHPGWSETELRTFVDGLISSAGVETFNGRSGNVTLNKDDVNNLLIANCYFAEADETIENIDVLALYKLGIRIIFTQYSSEVDGYTLAYGIEYYPTTDTAKAYLFSSGSGGVGAVVSVNGKTGTVVLKASDILMNNGDSVENAVSNAKAIANAAYSPDNPPPYPVNSVNGKTGSVMLKVVDVSNGDSVDDNAYIFIDETENYPDIIAPDSNKLGGQIPSYYATAESVNSLKNDKVNVDQGAGNYGKVLSIGADGKVTLSSTAICNTPQMFGALADGVTDDTEAIQAAIDALPDGGGTVYFPAGIYRISKPIIIGNGDAGHNQSTKNAIKLIGASGARSGLTPPVELLPLNKIGSIIEIRGFISNIIIDGFYLACNGLADYGLKMTAVQHSEFDDIEIYNPAVCGLGIYGGGLPTGNYNIYNDFKDILVTLISNSTIGLEMDGVYTTTIEGEVVRVNNDTWISTFDRCRFQSMGDAVNCKCAVLKFVDSISFRRCHFYSYNAGSCGIEFNAIGHDTFPAGIAFYDCSISNYQVVESDTAKMRKCYSIGHGTFDNEVVPNSGHLVGVTDAGIPFGGWAGSPTSESYKALNFGLAEAAVAPDGRWFYICFIYNIGNGVFTTISGIATGGDVVYENAEVYKTLLLFKIY